MLAIHTFYFHLTCKVYAWNGLVNHTNVADTHDNNLSKYNSFDIYLQLLLKHETTSVQKVNGHVNKLSNHNSKNNGDNPSVSLWNFTAIENKYVGVWKNLF